MELHDNMWEPTIRTGNTRWETMKYLQDANLDDVHSKLVWDQLNEIMGAITVIRSPWEQQGWWTFTSRWMTEHLRKRGIQQTDYIVQQRLSKNGVVFSSSQDHIHWTDIDGKWLFDTDTDDSGYYAYIVPSTGGPEIGA